MSPAIFFSSDLDSCHIVAFFTWDSERQACNKLKRLHFFLDTSNVTIQKKILIWTIPLLFTCQGLSMYCDYQNSTSTNKNDQFLPWWSCQQTLLIKVVLFVKKRKSYITFSIHRFASLIFHRQCWVCLWYLLLAHCRNTPCTKSHHSSFSTNDLYELIKNIVKNFIDKCSQKKQIFRAKH